LRQQKCAEQENEEKDKNGRSPLQTLHLHIQTH
jgi:hypothetical protein